METVLLNILILLIQKKWYNKFNGQVALSPKEAIENGFLVLPKDGIKLSDLIESLVFDMEACSIRFNEWCDNFGYDSDSRKALDIYLKS
jgi:hypothetical protein